VFHEREEFNELLRKVVSCANIYDKYLHDLVKKRVTKLTYKNCSVNSNILIMTYSTWTEEKHISIETSEFVLLKDFLLALNACRRIHFSVKSVREQTRQILSDLKRHEISKDVRAPLKPFVNLTNSVFADLYDSMVNALDFGDKLALHTSSISPFRRFMESCSKIDKDSLVQNGR